MVFEYFKKRNQVYVGLMLIDCRYDFTFLKNKKNYTKFFFDRLSPVRKNIYHSS